MGNNKKVGVFIQWGFHEIRSVILSGLVTKLNTKYETVIYTFDKGSLLYQSYLENAGVAFKYLDPENFDVKIFRFDAVNESIRKAYMRKNGVGNFRNYETPKNLSKIDYLKGCNLIWSLSSKITRYCSAKKYKNKNLTEFLLKEGITDIFLGGYSHINNRLIAFSGQEIGIQIWSLVNSWKDLYSNDFVSFSPKGLFTWSDSMTKNFKLHNPHLQENVYSIGNPAFDIFFDFKPVHAIEFYNLKYGISPEAIIFIYTMANPLVTEDEHLSILLVYEALRKNVTRNWHLLIRKNPCHNQREYSELEALENVSFMEHYWEWDPAKDLAVQRKEGEIEWYDMIHFSTCNISVASTVSMEFLVSKKIVINIGFNGTGYEDENLVRFSEAPYYKTLCDEPNVFICNSIGQFNSVLANFSDMFVFDNRFQINEYFKAEQKSVDTIISLL